MLEKIFYLSIHKSCCSLFGQSPIVIAENIAAQVLDLIDVCSFFANHCKVRHPRKFLDNNYCIE